MWHTSLNAWIIRYMYIPLGGAKHRFTTLTIIFTFIALWHEFRLHLLCWALMNVFGICIEILCTQIVALQIFTALHAHPSWAYIRAIGGIACQCVLTLTNSVGFTFTLHGFDVLINAYKVGADLFWGGVLLYVGIVYWWIVKSDMTIEIKNKRRKQIT